MHDQMIKFTVTEAIKKRESIRTYKQEPLPEHLKTELQEFSQDISEPFKASVRLEFIHDNELASSTGGKIGTYGVISGASSYIAAVVNQGEAYNMEALGYKLEHLILYATHLGLGTCWLGGTFDRQVLKQSGVIDENETVPIITPVGFDLGKKRLLESAMKMASGSKKRKPWQELFFYDSFRSPINKEQAGIFATALEMVRLAPSGMNKQPWRIVKLGNDWHFFLAPTKLAGKSLAMEMQRIDLGIAMCHFDLTARELGIKGQWVVDESNEQQIDIPGSKNYYYIATWRI